MAKGGYVRGWACARVGMFVGGGRLCGEIMVEKSLWEGGFCRECLQQMSVVRVCHCATFQQNHAIPGRVIAMPPSAILDIRRGCTWTTPRIAGPHFLRTHQIWWRHLDRRRRYAPKTEFEKTSHGGGILFPVSMWTPSILWKLSYVSPTKTTPKSGNRRPSYGGRFN